MSERWMIGVAGVGVAAWVLVPLAAILWPRRQRDPHDGMAVGCLMLFMIPGVVLAGMLVAGVALDVPVLVRITFWIVAFPLALVAVNLLFVYPYHRIRMRRGH